MDSNRIGKIAKLITKSADNSSRELCEVYQIADSDYDAFNIILLMTYEALATQSMYARQQATYPINTMSITDIIVAATDIEKEVGSINNIDNTAQLNKNIRQEIVDFIQNLVDENSDMGSGWITYRNAMIGALEFLVRYYFNTTAGALNDPTLNSSTLNAFTDFGKKILKYI